MKPLWMISLLLVSALSSCKQEPMQQNIDNLSEGYLYRLGKGGMGIANLYPLNSYESVLQSLYAGADGVELDLQMSSDGVLVAYHDETLEAASGEGILNEYTWTELQELRYRPAPYAEYQLASLDTLLKRLPDAGSYTFSLDCKLFPAGEEVTEAYLDQFADALVKLEEYEGGEMDIQIESRNLDFLRKLQDRNVDFNLFFLADEYTSGRDAALAARVEGISMEEVTMTKTQVDDAHDNGLLVQLYGTNNEQENRDAVSKHPDYIQTNDIVSLVELLPQ